MVFTGAATQPYPELREGSIERVRALRPDDIPEIVALRRQVFRFSERASGLELAAYFQRMFLGLAARGDLPSLVCEDDHGRVAGFLGVVPRSMEFRGRPLRVAVGTQLMVRPGTRGVAGTGLVRAFVNGPQDLALSDTANDPGQRIWERVGGTTSAAHSLFWTRSLRPWRYAAGRTTWSRGAASRALARAARPLFDLLDRAGPEPWAQRAMRGETGPLDSPLMLTHFGEICGGRSLRPTYHDGSLDWLLEQLAEKRLFGELHQAAVWSAPGALAGWFLYFASHGGVAQVAQIATRPGASGLVLDHLFHHAWRNGAVAVSGRLEPALLPALSARGCTFDRDGPWTLMHARDGAIVHAIEQGDAFLSRLEGEWWMSF